MNNINSLIRYHIILAAISGFLYVTGCSSSDPILNSRIDEYYSAEKNNDWSKVYSLRTSEFKKSVKKEDFISDMKDASKGWDFLEYEIKEVSFNKELAKAKIVFIEKPPKEYWAGSGMKESKIKTDAYSLWIKEGDAWFCKETPSRSYLPYSK